MMSIKDVISVIDKTYPNRYVTAIVMYKGDFLVCAPEKGIGEEDISDPYFVVSSKDGSVKHFLPTSDITGFAKAIRGKVLYKK